jgi:hypothetical protein
MDSEEKTMQINLSIINTARINLTAGLLFMLLNGTASAVPLLLEGPISALSANPDGSGSITVMGVVVDIPAGTPITSPTAALTIVQAADPAPLPGRMQPGFLGGTAIIEGDSVGGVNTAATLFMEPSENILGADVTSVPPAPIAIAGIALAELTDPRIPAGPVMNDFGFEVDPATVPTGVDAVAEGYLSNDGTGVFQYFLLAVADGTMINAAQTEVSVTRARCIAGANPGDPIELRVLGAVHDPATGSVTIKDFGPTTFGTVTAIADISPFGLYSLVLRNNPAFQVCPASVTVEFNGATAVAAVDGGSPDVDGDGVRDGVDNCMNVVNGPLSPDAGGNIQLDTDGDGFGNICDADLDNSGGTVNLDDFFVFRGAFGQTGTPAADNADLDGDGNVNLDDFFIFRGLFGSAPGPSGLNP